jgi:hypothetical protein
MSWLRLMEEQLTETEHRPPAQKKPRVLQLVKDMWPAYLIEIVVIILGITITLALEEWREGQKEDRLATVYLKNLRSDIAADRQDLAYASGGSRDILAAGYALLDSAPASFDVDVRRLLGRPKFLSRDATFSDLKSSGNLHLLKDIDLKNLLFAYYSLAQGIKEAQDAEQQAVITISGPYFLKRFPLGGDARNATGEAGHATGNPRNATAPGGQATVARAAPPDFEFRNNVLLRLDTREELLSDYRRADSLAERLTTALGNDQ